MKLKIEFQPTSYATLRLLSEVQDQTRSMQDTYSQLISAAIVAAKLIGFTRDQLCHQMELFGDCADAAIAANPDLFEAEAPNEIH